MVNIRDVARYAQTSPTTVSRFLNHDPKLVIKESTRERIIQTCKLLDYSLRPYKGKRQDFSIGIITSSSREAEAEESYFRTIRHHVLSLAKKEGFGIAFTVYVANAMSVWSAISEVTIVILIGHLDRVLMEEIYKRNHNVVSIEDYYADRKFHAISIDFHHEARLIFDRLERNGYQRLAFIGGQNARIGINDTFYPDGIGDREGAFLEWRNRQKTQYPQPCYIGATWDSRCAADLTTKLLQEAKRFGMPDCIVAASDVMATGVISCLNKHGIQIPNEVGICSFNNVEISQLTKPALTTLHINLSEIAAWTIEVCKAIVRRGQDAPIKVTLGGDLIIRESLRVAKEH